MLGIVILGSPSHSRLFCWPCSSWAGRSPIGRRNVADVYCLFLRGDIGAANRNCHCFFAASIASSGPDFLRTSLITIAGVYDSSEAGRNAGFKNSGCWWCNCFWWQKCLDGNADVRRFQTIGVFFTEWRESGPTVTKLVMLQQILNHMESFLFPRVNIWERRKGDGQKNPTCRHWILTNTRLQHFLAHIGMFKVMFVYSTPTALFSTSLFVFYFKYHSKYHSVAVLARCYRTASF